MSALPLPPEQQAVKRRILPGEKLHHLTILRQAASKPAKYLCLCVCGKEKVARGSDLRSGGTKSCGCLRITHGHNAGGVWSPEYSTWRAMLSRCQLPSDPGYKNYGERGVEVCREWKDFQTFLRDMGNRPSLSHSIDRINTNGDYCPENCRWATRLEQANNTTRNHFLTLNGETATVAQWAQKLGHEPSMIYARLKSGWSIEDVLLKPRRNRKKRTR